MVTRRMDTKMYWQKISILFTKIRKQRPIVLMGRLFANGLGDRGSISGRVIPKTQKIVLDTSLLNTKHYKVRVKNKGELSRERNSTPPLHFGVVSFEKGAFGSPSTMVTNFTNIYIYIYIMCVRVSIYVCMSSGYEYLNMT